MVPRTAEVIVVAPGLRTPRMAMHRCSACTTTITPRRFEPAHHGVGHLRGQPLLHLRSAGVHVHHSGQLRQPVIRPSVPGM